mmetsp:Transcript_93854/g.265504  ORF Transcript_93854/g.265504 Transcript_93854/m.265504 type:complete len:123 (-) Transcript_93854:188-556(-)
MIKAIERATVRVTTRDSPNLNTLAAEDHWMGFAVSRAIRARGAAKRAIIIATPAEDPPICRKAECMKGAAGDGMYSGPDQASDKSRLLALPLHIPKAKLVALAAPMDEDIPDVHPAPRAPVD